MLRKTPSALIAFLILALAVSSSPVFAEATGKVDLTLDPATVSGKPGDTFELTIKAVPSSQKLVAMDVFLDFDPHFLEAVDSLPSVAGVQIKPGTVLTLLFANNVNNAAGDISFGAGMPPGTEYGDTAPLTVATVTFKIKETIPGSTEVKYHTGDPRQTLVAYAGDAVQGSLTGASITIAPPAAPPPPPAVAASPPPAEAPAPAPPANPPLATEPAPTQQVSTPAPAPQPPPAVAPKPVVKSTLKTTPPAPPPAKASLLKTTLDKLYSVSEKVVNLPWWVWIIVGLICFVGMGRMVVRILIKTGRLKVEEEEG